MSASSKKKLRNAEQAAKLTERQLAEQKEAKKVRLYTIAFVVTLVAIFAIAIIVGVNQTISNSGIREKNTVAMSVNGQDLSNAELNYFYIDALNNFYSQSGSYASLLGLDVSKPLNEQYISEETGETWADYFLTEAKSSAKAVYALGAAAGEAGYTLEDEDAENVEALMSSLELYATLYGYGDSEAYLKAMYGQGSTLDSYRSYVELSLLAQGYQEAYQASLTYDDAALREAEKDNYNQYSSFAYNYYYLKASRFLEGGTTDETTGTTTYSDEETAASVSAAEEAAKSLTGSDITTAAELDEAISALPVNASSSTVSTRYDSQLYTRVNTLFADWLADSSRKEGDLTYVASTSTDSDGAEVVNGYYIVRFESVNDNTMELKDVRHILVSFEGGTTDETTGSTTYSDEEKAAAKTAAEEILAEWKAGEATEASFSGLAAEKSDDTGSSADGGLIADIHPGSSLVTNFLNWSIDDSRKEGDTGIVETEYGYHVMYYVGENGVTYRDSLIRDELSANDITDWYNGIVEAAEVTEGSVKYLSLDLVIGS